VCCPQLRGHDASSRGTPDRHKHLLATPLLASERHLERHGLACVKNDICVTNAVHPRPHLRRPGVTLLHSVFRVALEPAINKNFRAGPALLGLVPNHTQRGRTRRPVKKHDLRMHQHLVDVHVSGRLVRRHQ